VPAAAAEPMTKLRLSMNTSLKLAGNLATPDH
jgi:hypothetical protein